jgi:thiamine-phosphate pyrophosphorylase
VRRADLGDPDQARSSGRRARLLSHAASASSPRPWFAIGGISLDRLDEVIALGARRVVVVRAITDAEDPGAAARAFATRLARAAA